MSPVKFRKSLLALAITACALPAYAQTLQLTNDGLLLEDTRFTDNVEITGAFNSSTLNEDAVQIAGSKFEKDLVFNATITSSGKHPGGIDMDTFDAGKWPDNGNTVGGNLINKGHVSATGIGATAWLIDPVTVEGDVINEGVLMVRGEPEVDEDDGSLQPVRAVNISGSSHIKGDFKNATGAQILADGTDAKALRMEGGTLDGKIINNGLILVSGNGSTAVDLTSQEYFNGMQLVVDRATVRSIENNGKIVATGDDAEGIRVDGANFTQADAHIVNNGSIQAEDAAIVVGGFTVNGKQAELEIINNGVLTSLDEAVDASESDSPVRLTLANGSQTNGNLIDLSQISVQGNASFTGTDSTADGANIRMKNGGWVDVGSKSAPGHLDLGLAHTSLDGNLYVAGNSSLGLNLSSATDANKAVLSVSGTAQFGEGSQIKLAAKGSDFRADGTTYTLVEANDLQDNGLKVTSSSSLLNVDSYVVENNQIVTKVTSKNSAEVGDVIANIGGSQNAQQAGAAFSQVATQLAQLNPQDPLFQHYVSASNNPEALKKLAEQLAPEVNGGATQAATTSQSLISNVTGNRTGGGRGLSSGDTLKETGVWVQSLYSDATQDMRDGVAGFNAYSRGIAVGADGKVNDQVTLGVAYSYLNTDVNGKAGSKTEVDSHAFTLYGGFEQGNYFVDAGLTYGMNDNDSQRTVGNTKAKAGYDSTLFGVNLVGGYTYNITPDMLIEPRVAARYSLVDIDGYREKGSSAALKVKDQRYEVAELGAGLRVAANYPLGQGTLTPQAKVMAFHDFAADQASSTSTFTLGNTPFVTSGAKAVRNSYEAGIGADYRLGAVTVGLNYDYVGKSGFDADTVSAKVRYDF